MKNKFVVINSLLSIVILFSILFQSVHSYEHLAKQLTEKKCLHKHNSRLEITHEHHKFDHCFVCDFTLSSFISADSFHYNLKNTTVISGYSYFKSKEITQFFKGSLFSLRAPPCFIV